MTTYRSAVDPSRASAALLGAAAGLEPVTLQEVVAHAELQTRVDLTYLVPLPAVPLMVERLAGYRVLEIDGRRDFGYESVYFDTADLLTYRQHLRGQRSRFKIRTRTYLDSGDSVLETKVKGGRGETIKHRLPYDARTSGRLTGQAHEFIAERIRQPDAVAHLRPTIVTTYRRVTLADLATGARVTCDVDLAYWAPSHAVAATQSTPRQAVAAPPAAPRQAVAATPSTPRRAVAAFGPDGYVLVETKSAGTAGLADRVLRGLGVRPVSISKYCVGVAMLLGPLPASPWSRTMRVYFDWHRRPEP